MSIGLRMGMRGKGLPLRLHPLTVPLLCFTAAVMPPGRLPFLISCLLAATAHEAGHLLCMTLLDVPLCGFTVTPLGAVLRGNFMGVSYGKEGLVHASGPLVNLICGSLFLLSGAEEPATAHFLLCGYNLLPMDSFDGGRLLHAVLCSLTGDGAWAVRIVTAVSFGTRLLLYAASGWFFWFCALHGGDALSGAALFGAALSGILAWIGGDGTGKKPRGVCGEYLCKKRGKFPKKD